jgi:hypothetical protein
MGAVYLVVFGPFQFYFSNFGLISFPQTYSFIYVVLVQCVCYVVWQVVSLWRYKFSMNFPKLQDRSSVRVFVEVICSI